MLEKLQVFCHSSIKITGSKIIYIDPYQIKEKKQDADYIFCTHSHYDHFSPQDIKKIIKEDTVIITVKDCIQEVNALQKPDKIILVKPEEHYQLEGISFSTTYAYNQTKSFHPKEKGWVGYLILLDGITYFVAGDTDKVKEIENITCDVALLPVGGTYTMDYEEAANLANCIGANDVVPIHYGTVVGTKQDAEEFRKKVIGKKVSILY